MRGMKLVIWGSLMLCAVTSQASNTGNVSVERLVYRYTDQYQLIWDDSGSHSRKDLSIWRPISTDTGFFPVGDTAVGTCSPPQHSAVLVQDKGDGLVHQPERFRKVWSDAGSSCSRPVTLYKMIPAANYSCVGHVAVRSYRRCPKAEHYRCVRSDLVTPGAVSQIWDTSHFGAKKDMSLWRVESEPTIFNGLPVGAFLSVPAKHTQPDTALLLNANQTELCEFVRPEEPALTLIETRYMECVWSNNGQKAPREISVWRVQQLFNVGDVAVAGYGAPHGVAVRGNVPGALSVPISFRLVWSGPGKDVAVWRPSCEAGYVALGEVTTRGPDYRPSNHSIRCVNVDYVVPGRWTRVLEQMGEQESVWRSEAMNTEGRGVYAMSVSDNHIFQPLVLNASFISVHTGGKPVARVLVYSIKYDFRGGEDLSRDPLQLSERKKVINCAGESTSPPLSEVVQLPYEACTQSEWKIESTLGVENGVVGSLEAGIPNLSTYTVSPVSSVSFTLGSGIRQEECDSEELSAHVTVPPGHETELAVSGWRVAVRVPWKGMAKIEYMNGHNHVRTLEGVYVGVYVTEAAVTRVGPRKCDTQ
ncbi:uncharacterized protein LOC142502659 [Ascaphus truei]|uniref:uncharacterized protein LOC142502659 n=1 Tax=Ascaphus truei TaxID=8439 RepID=UPI003F59C51F